MFVWLTTKYSVEFCLVFAMMHDGLVPVYIHWRLNMNMTFV